jgi:hypothetical protein
MTEGAIEQGGTGPRADEPPAMLRHAIDAAPPLDPVRPGTAVTSMHQTWARVDAAGGREDTGVRRRVARLVPGPSSQALRDDRMLIGELIRAADALAARCDELADRVMALEGALAEVVEVFGADLTRLRAAGLTAARDDEVRSPHA